MLGFRAKLCITDPWVLCQLLGRNARARANVEYLAEQASYFFIAQVTGNLSKLTALNFAEKIRFKLPKERHLADINYIQNDTTGPYVRRERVVGLLAHYIRVHIMWCTAIDAQFFFCADPLTETEVNDFDVLASEVHQNIVKFQISVGVPFRVHISYTAHKLFKYVFTLLLGQPLVRLLFNVVID